MSLLNRFFGPRYEVYTDTGDFIANDKHRRFKDAFTHADSLNSIRYTQYVLNDAGGSGYEHYKVRRINEHQHKADS